MTGVLQLEAITLAGQQFAQAAAHGVRHGIVRGRHAGRDVVEPDPGHQRRRGVVDLGEARPFSVRLHDCAIGAEHGDGRGDGIEDVLQTLLATLHLGDVDDAHDHAMHTRLAGEIREHLHMQVRTVRRLHFVRLGPVRAHDAAAHGHQIHAGDLGRDVFERPPDVLRHHVEQAERGIGELADPQ